MRGRALRRAVSREDTAVVAWGWYSVVEFDGPGVEVPALGGAGLIQRPTHQRAAFWAAWWIEDPRRTVGALPDAVGVVTGFECPGGAIDDADHALRLHKGAFVYALHIPPSYALAVYKSGAKVRASLLTDFIAAAFTALGLAPDATVEEIGRAYRALVLPVHPDHGGDPVAFAELTQHRRVAIAHAIERAARGISSGSAEEQGR